MPSFFEFPIWDRHKVITFDEEGNQFITPVNDKKDSEPFKRMSVRIDTDTVKIEHIVEFMLFQNDEDPPIRASFLYLNDGSQYICRQIPETIAKNYLAHFEGKVSE